MPPQITYTIAMPHPHTHLFEVELRVDGLRDTILELALPVWTPGSYMVREYARHVQEFAAQHAQQPLAWSKTDKSTWQVETGGAPWITVTYRVYAFELTVRTSHLDGTHGYFNPATLCMYVPGRLNEPHAVHVIAPNTWQVTTGLPGGSEPTWAMYGRRWSFLAQDYDELVDSPFECGTHRLLTFEVDGIPHEIALWGHGNEDETRILEDTRRIVLATRELFGALPYERYVFIVHLVDGRGGGLEHRNSVTNQLNRWTFAPASQYEHFLHLTAHEFYHVWNVKRLRPEPLGPFDYQRENYTRMLWTMEGITSYYDNLILVRSGLITPERYLELLAEAIKILQSQPGRLIQSLELSSFDTWIKLYRPDENSANSSISYYLKGSLVALLLDLEIRGRTGGECSLDEVQRELFKRYPISGPGFPETDGFLRAVEAMAGEDDGGYATFLRRSISTTEELDYERGFAVVGLQPVWSHSSGNPGAWLGAQTKTEHGKLKVVSVTTDGPGMLAGIYAHDELIALDGFRIDEAGLKARLAERQPGQSVTLSLFRGEQLLHVAVELAPAPPDRLDLVSLEHVSEEQRRQYVAWLTG